LNDLRESITATPAVLDGRLYVRTAKHVYAFGEEDSTNDPCLAPRTKPRRRWRRVAAPSHPTVEHIRDLRPILRDLERPGKSGSLGASTTSIRAAFSSWSEPASMCAAVEEASSWLETGLRDWLPAWPEAFGRARRNSRTCHAHAGDDQACIPRRRVSLILLEETRTLRQ